MHVGTRITCVESADIRQSGAHISGTPGGDTPLPGLTLVPGRATLSRLPGGHT